MIRQKYQRHTDASQPDLGDCFATCVAMVLDLDQDEVPNFCAAGDDWWDQFQAWLAERGLVAIQVRIHDASATCTVVPGVPVIVTGPSPRGPWEHSVVWFLDEGLAEQGFDPNPAGGFLAGPPMSMLFFGLLRPDLHSRPSSLASHSRFRS